MRLEFMLGICAVVLGISALVCFSMASRKPYQLNYHTIEVHGIDGLAQDVQISVSTDLYTVLDLTRFDSHSTTTEGRTSGLIFSGPTPNWATIDVIVNGTNFSGRYEIPSNTKNRVAVNGIHFALNANNLVGHHTYGAFSDKRDRNEWENTTEWRFREDGSIQSVEKKFKRHNDDLVRITWEFVNGDADLREVMINKIRREQGGEYFYFKDDALESSSWFSGWSVDVPVKYHFNANGTLLRVTTKSENNEWTVKVPVVPDMKIPMPSDVHAVLPKPTNWNTELKRAGLVL